MANLHAVLIKDAQQTVEMTTTKRKYPMKINKNKSFAKLKLNIVQVFLTNKPKKILKILHDFFKKEEETGNNFLLEPKPKTKKVN